MAPPATAEALAYRKYLSASDPGCEMRSLAVSEFVTLDGLK
jgi:hypothetical protein